MKREKLFQDKKTMPRINQGVAKRFVRHELWTPKNKEADEEAVEEDKSVDDSSGQPDGHVNKKRRCE